MNPSNQKRDTTALGYVLLFLAGMAVGLPLRAWAGPEICRAVADGDQFWMRLVSATRDGESVMPSAGFQGTIENAAAMDRGLLSAYLYLDTEGKPGAVSRKLRRVP